MKRTAKERFDAFWIPEPNSGCWLWLGMMYAKYGGFKIGSTRDGTRRQVYAHRFAYELTNRKVPDGLFVLHSCDNKMCVNPDHLSVGTTSQNHKEAYARGLRKVQLGRAKLTPSDIHAIRQSTEKQRVLAARYGVSGSRIADTRNLKTWKHI